MKCVEDSYGKDPSSILFGGIYGFLTPNEMVAKPADLQNLKLPDRQKSYDKS